MYSFVSSGKRLVLDRFTGNVSEPQFKEFRSRLLEVIARAGRPIVTCFDHRTSAPLVGETGLITLGLMRSVNRSIERTAAILERGTEVATQLQEAIEEARSPSRRAFYNTSEAMEWLGQVLTADEVAELKRFLAAGSEPRPAR
jgi:hypothetical protein